MDQTTIDSFLEGAKEAEIVMQLSNRHKLSQSVNHSANAELSQSSLNQPRIYFPNPKPDREGTTEDIPEANGKFAPGEEEIDEEREIRLKSNPFEVLGLSGTSDNSPGGWREVLEKSGPICREIPCKIFADFPKTPLREKESYFERLIRLSERANSSEEAKAEFEAAEIEYRNLRQPGTTKATPTERGEEMEVVDGPLPAVSANLFRSPNPTGRIKQQQRAAVKQFWGGLMTKEKTTVPVKEVDPGPHLAELGKQLQDVSNYRFSSQLIAIHNVPMPSEYDANKKFGAEVSMEEFSENVMKIQAGFQEFVAQLGGPAVAFDLEELGDRLFKKTAVHGKGSGGGAILVKLSCPLEFGSSGAILERLPVCCLVMGSPRVIPPSGGYDRPKSYDRSFMVEGLECQDHQAFRHGKLVAIFRGGPAVSSLGGTLRLAVQQLAESLLHADRSELTAMVTPAFIQQPFKAKPRLEYNVLIYVNRMANEARRRALETLATNRIAKKGSPMAWQVGPFRLESSLDFDDHRGVLVCTPLLAEPYKITEISIPDLLDPVEEATRILQRQPPDVIRAVAGVLVIPTFFDAASYATLSTRLAVVWSGDSHRDLVMLEEDDFGIEEPECMVGTEAFRLTMEHRKVSDSPASRPARLSPSVGPNAFLLATPSATPAKRIGDRAGPASPFFSAGKSLASQMNAVSIPAEPSAIAEALQANPVLARQVMSQLVVHGADILGDFVRKAVAEVSGKVSALEGKAESFNERIIQGSMATQKLRNEKVESDRCVEEVREGLGNLQSRLVAQQEEVVETRRTIKVLSKIAKAQAEQKKSSDAKLDAILAMLAGQAGRHARVAEGEDEVEWTEEGGTAGDGAAGKPAQVLKEMVQESLEEAMARANRDLDSVIQEVDGADSGAAQKGCKAKRGGRRSQPAAAGVESAAGILLDLTRPSDTIDLVVLMNDAEELFTTGADPTEEAKQARTGMKAAGRGDKTEKVDEAMEQKAESREAMINQLRSKVPIISEEDDPEKPGTTEVPDDDNPSPDGSRRRKGQ